MTLPGGGPMELNPGQVTDESELAMCLMTALKGMKLNELNIEKIAKQYARWEESKPFDFE